MGYIGTKPANAALTSADIEDGIITAPKIATDAVETVKVKDLNVTTGKLAADAVTNAKTEFTPGLTIKGDGASADGKLTLNCSQNSHGVSIAGPPHSAAQSYTLTLPQSITNDYYLKTDGSGNLSFAAVATYTDDLPTITSLTPSVIPNDATAVVIAGTNFVSIPKVEIIASTGAITVAPTVTFTSATSIQFTTGTGLASGTYFIRLINPDGGTVTTSSALFTTSPGPAWTTAAGSLGSVAGGGSVNFTVAATDATSYAKTAGTFPGGVTINSSTGVISGTETGATGATTYNFTITATDAEAQTADRAFSIDITFGLSQSMAFV